MQIPQFRALFAAALLAFTGSAASGAAASADSALAAAVANPARSPAAVARDSVRHPVEELTFFGIAPTMSVVELWPGGGYWTDILGVYLAPHGHYTIALPAPGNGEEDGQSQRLRARIAAAEGPVRQHSRNHARARPLRHRAARLGRPRPDIPQSAQLDGWRLCGRSAGGDIQSTQARRHSRHGGTSRPQRSAAGSEGQERLCAPGLCDRAGEEGGIRDDRLHRRSNANPRDTKDWVDGVWTLPPTLSQGEKDRARYVAVGEADNFVIKFRKPR